MMDKKVYIIIAVIAVVAIAAVAYITLTGETEPGPPETPPPASAIAVTITSNPAGSGYIKVDGAAITTPQTFQWEEGSTHSLQAISSDEGTGDTRYSWISWSDGGVQTHDYTVTSQAETITATYDAQHKISVTQTGLDSTADENIVTVTVEGASETKSYADLPFSSWVDSGATVTYSFESNVSTTCPGAFFMLSDSESSSTITVNDATTVTGTYTRAIIDCQGNAITVPDPSEINGIADSWLAHNTVVVMCGAKDKLVATATKNTQNPMFQRILPGIENMLTPFNSDGTVNIEELMAKNPDVVFCGGGGDAALAMESSGLTVVRLQFYDFDDMIHAVRLTGWILGEEALENANAYIDYFNEKYDKVYTITSQISTSERQSVLHLRGKDGLALNIDAGEGLINTWINLCGGNNAAAEVPGNSKTVSFEQVLAWNPEMIIIGSTAANDVKDEILNDELWSDITAVKNEAVIVNPKGVFDWARYSVEEALNIQWVSKTLHPDLFSDIDIRAETAYFYETFYDYTLSEGEIDAILSSMPPP